MSNLKLIYFTFLIQYVFSYNWINQYADHDISQLQMMGISNNEMPEDFYRNDTIKLLIKRSFFEGITLGVVDAVFKSIKSFKIPDLNGIWIKAPYEIGEITVDLKNLTIDELSMNTDE